MAKKFYFGGEEYFFTTVKGNAETDYRSGDVNITPDNIGLGNVDDTADEDKSVKYAISAGSANSVDWSKVQNKPSSYTPSSHTHGNSDITAIDASKITSGTIDIERLPQGALDRLVRVADDTARFKLTTDDVQLGDTVQTLDNKKMYYVVDETKLATEDGYSAYTADTATSVPWSGVTGKPSSYTPSSHTHDDRYYTESEMNTKLAGKVDLSSDGVSKAINQLSTGTSDPTDNDYYISQYAGGGTTTTSYHRRPVSALWNYIKGKADKVYSALGHKHTKADITDFPTSMTAKGGDSDTVNGHTVNSDVPANAKFTDTTYASKAAVTGGTDVSLVTTGEKAVWNAKTSSSGTITGITMNGASKGTSGVIDLGTVLTGGKQTTTSTADGGSNVYTFSDNSTITVKNGSKGSAGSNGTSAAWFTGTTVTGTSTSATAFTVSGSKAGDMYLNTSTYNVYRASAANSWVYVCNIKGATGASGTNGTNGTNGVTPTIKASAGSNIGSVGTPSVTASTSGTTTTFTFNNLKGQSGSNGTRGSIINFGTAITGTSTTATIFSSSGLTSSLVNDMYLNTSTFNLYKCTTAGNASTAKWVYIGCIKGTNGTNATTTSVATTSANGLMSKDMVTKLNGIATGANAYTHPTTSGNKHIPSGGSSGQVLKWSADGTAVWGNETGGVGQIIATAEPTGQKSGDHWLKEF